MPHLKNKKQLIRENRKKRRAPVPAGPGCLDLNFYVGAQYL